MKYWQFDISPSLAPSKSSARYHGNSIEDIQKIFLRELGDPRFYVHADFQGDSTSGLPVNDGAMAKMSLSFVSRRVEHIDAKMIKMDLLGHKNDDFATVLA